MAPTVNQNEIRNSGNDQIKGFSPEEIEKYERTSPTNFIEQESSKDQKQIAELLENIPQLNDLFTIHGKIGEGTFSSVLVGSLKSNQNISERKTVFALKHLYPTSHPSRIERELKCLQELGGKDNIINVHLCLRSLNNVVFIMPYVSHKKFGDYVSEMEMEETKLYIRNLLIALKRVHSFGIIHRDIKPSNFLYDRENKKFLLIDFGLAQPVDINENKRKRVEDVQDNSNNQPTKRIALQPEVALKYISPNKENVYQREKTKIQQPSFKSPLADRNIVNIIPYPSVNTVMKKLSFNETTETKQNKINTQMNLKQQQKTTKPDICFSRPNNTKIKTPNPNTRYSLNGKSVHKCECYGKPRVCNICILRKGLHAPRAGTPGFRPPEVLLKYPNQTTAVDIWAVGVIFISILSGCYPFFRSPNDMTALAEIMTLFGTDAVKRLGRVLDRHLMVTESKSPIDLRKLCKALRFRNNEKPYPNPCNQCATNKSKMCLCFIKINEETEMFPASAFDLLYKLMDLNPNTRITAADALNHPFLN